MVSFIDVVLCLGGGLIEDVIISVEIMGNNSVVNCLVEFNDVKFIVINVGVKVVIDVEYVMIVCEVIC